MEINIVEEVYKLRTNLLKAVNENPLPMVVRLMIVNEIASAMKTAEINEIMKSKELKEPKQKDKKKEG